MKSSGSFLSQSTSAFSVKSLKPYGGHPKRGLFAVFFLLLVIAGTVAEATTLNVKDYGAIGDGVSDDTDAIRAALDEAQQLARGASSLVTLYFPAGTYAVAPKETDASWPTDQPYIFKITTGNLELVGDGPDLSIISCYTLGLKDPETNWTVIGDGSEYFKIKRGGAFRVWNQFGNTIENLRFEGLRITGNTTATGNSAVGGIPSTGDGWDMSHKGIHFNGYGEGAIRNVEIINCHVDHWRGENIYAGGLATGNVLIRNTHVYHSNASAISMSAGVIIEDSVIHSCYNAFENFALKDYQYLEVRRCEVSSSRAYGGKFGVAYLGTPHAYLIVEDSDFTGFGSGQIYLAEAAYNVVIRNNTFRDASTAGIFFGRLGLYGAYPDKDFNDILIDNNHFIAENTDMANGIYFQVGEESRNDNFTVSNNRFEGVNGKRLIRAIYEVIAPKTANRKNYRWVNNYFACMDAQLEHYAGRAVWESNTYAPGIKPYTVHWWHKDLGPEIFKPVGGRFLFSNFSEPGLNAVIDPATLDQYPVGYRCELTTEVSAHTVLPVDPTWNNFTQDVVVSKDGGPVVIEFQDNGKFGLAGTIVTEPSPVAPAAPTISMDAVGIGSLSLSWSSAEAVDSFELQVSAGGATYTNAGTFAATVFSASFDTLVEGESYQYRVRSVRGGLSSDWSEGDVVTTLVSEPTPVAPAAPTISMDAVGIGSLSLSWSSAEAVDSFELQVSAGGATYTNAGTFAATVFSASFDTLVEGESYQYRVRSVRGGLSSDWTEGKVVTTLVSKPTPVAPAAPTISMDAVGIGSLSLSWSSAEAVESFELQVSAGGAAYTSAGTFAATVFSASFDNLVEGESYQCRVRSVRGGLSSDWSEGDVVTTLVTEPTPIAPAAPTISISSVGTNSIGLLWNTAEPVDSFEVEMNKLGGSFRALSPVSTFSGAQIGVLAEGLDEDTGYSFRIRSIRQGLASDWAYTGNVKTETMVAPVPPSAPVLSAAAVDASSILLSWTASESVNSFELEFSESGSGFVALDPVSGGVFEAVVEELLASESYVFRIRAVRDDLASEWAESGEVAPLDDSNQQVEDPFAPIHIWDFDDVQGTTAQGSGLHPLALDVSEATVGEGIGPNYLGLLFDQPHSGIQIPDTDTLNRDVITELTVSVWIKVEEADVKRTSVVYEQGGFWRGLNLIIDNGWIQANGWNRPSKESDWAGTTLNGGKLILGEWNHIAVVLSGGPIVQEGALRIFVNGMLADSGAGSQLWKQNDDNGIGQVQQSTVYRGRQVRSLDPFIGSIDDVAIWHTALTEQDIETLVLSAY
jgi:fibronectin type 3 domain-containing protein